MRLILPFTSTNPDLPVIDPVAGLLSATLIAGYKMLDNTDFSGNGNNFTWSGTFNSTGAILANDANHIMTTPIMEQDTMTVIMCFNIPSSNPVASLLNNLKTNSTPYQGTRLTKFAGAGQTTGQFDVATSGTSITSLTTAIDNGWMLKAYTWNGTNLRVIQHAGGYTDLALPSRTKGTVNAYRMNGIPTTIGGGSTTGGVVSGTMGPVLFYNEYMTVSKAVGYMNLVAAIMSNRGVTVP